MVDEDLISILRSQISHYEGVLDSIRETSSRLNREASDLVDSLHAKIERLEEAVDERDTHVEALLSALARAENEIKKIKRYSIQNSTDTTTIQIED